MLRYTITRVDPALVQDSTGQWVNGKRVYFKIDDYNEIHFIEVTSIDTKIVSAAMDNYLKQRDALAKLGQAPS